MTCRHRFFLKQTLLVFWSIWLTLVCLTNVFEWAKVLGLLGEDWAFASGNYRFVVETTARYDTPGWLNSVFFAGAICWQGLAAVLFWSTLLRFGGPNNAGRAPLLHAAFTVSLMHWAAFMVADEVFISYTLEAIHIRLFIAQLTTLLVVELLPEKREPAGS